MAGGVPAAGFTSEHQEFEHGLGSGLRWVDIGPCALACEVIYAINPVVQ